MNNRFVFVTDIHCGSTNNVRTGDYLADISRKLEWVVSEANRLDAVLLIGGDVFDRAVVPYTVTNTVIRLLKGAKYLPLCIRGNHDMLYRADENRDKTALAVLYEAGVVRSFDGGGIGILTNTLPIENVGHPQILVYHGLYEMEDGYYSVWLKDINVTEPTLVLLGHDHTEYGAEFIKDNVLLVRCGSLARCTRVSESYRVPKVVYIEYNEGADAFPFSVRFMDVPCRPCAEIFKVKVDSIESEAVDAQSYDDLVGRLRDSGSSDIDFMGAVRGICSEDISSYIEEALSTARLGLK